MGNLELWYPAKPFVLNQVWGVYNSAYLQFGFSQHNGIDIRLGNDKKLYAPFNGEVIRIGNQPNGGGIFCGFISDETYTFPDKVKARVLVDMLHCELITSKIGVKYKVGDELAIADNTGFSTGPHTHLQFRRVAWDGKEIKTLDVNGANNSFDPTPFWNGKYSSDEKVKTLTALLELTKRLLALFKK